MANVRLEAKFDTAAARANLARSYRLMANAMATNTSRKRLLHMAEKLERTNQRICPAGSAGSRAE